MIWWLLACATPEPAPPERVQTPDFVVAQDWAPPEPVWPALAAPLTPPPLGEGAGPWKIYIDPGHGWKGNHGNTGVLCRRESDTVAEVAARLGDRLAAMGPFEVRVGRKKGQERTYGDRVAEAHDWGAAVYLCLHSDVRFTGPDWDHWWEPGPGQRCRRRDDAAGFAVLWGDNGEDAALVADRHRLARDVAKAMDETGFPAYDGSDYRDLYAHDSVPGVFLDRHEPGRRLFVLRTTRMPSVIIETHHALYLEESRRWEEPRTIDAFSDAVGAALVGFLTGG